MNGNSDTEPNFVIINDTKELQSVRTLEEIEQTVKQSEEVVGDKYFNKIEIELIEKLRHKLRLFDPQGIYTFRDIEIGYGQSIIHLCSLLLSLSYITFYLYGLIVMTNPDEMVPGLGYVSDINVLDKLCFYFILIFTFSKIKKLTKVKVGKYSIRYKIALCANSLNRVLLDIFKLMILMFFITFTYTYTPDITPSILIKIYLNGVVGDTISFIEWLIIIIIVVRTLKPFGEGAAK
ncbi:hypothetical protein GCM10008107_05170 [Psychrosphaera saromensis]|uniref:Uncharacterized protein n=1 Tax=Psychrosphaera saromensis TaxID=716813 RepID=A0A2S7UZ41_9GAMM|nr:hypothetical protein [Psychrosphaera saromensis]PQJ54551.1 hypothetical protein BTO11_13440 [Psychrosphaera saromensis]GHB59012.1 hypothetical protein GCM10008107_05170 [Psychrosphaera saromensis]GLQ14238.1 hypothetical protein GCM10007917_16930 [Psychrosphaera saromensis]